MDLTKGVMSEDLSLGERALTPSVLLLGAVVVGAAAKVWLKRWREAVVNPWVERGDAS